MNAVDVVAAMAFRATLPKLGGAPRFEYPKQGESKTISAASIHTISFICSPAAVLPPCADALRCCGVRC